MSRATIAATHSTLILVIWRDAVSQALEVVGKVFGRVATRPDGDRVRSLGGSDFLGFPF